MMTRDLAVGRSTSSSGLPAMATGRRSAASASPSPSHGSDPGDAHQAPPGRHGLGPGGHGKMDLRTAPSDVAVVWAQTDEGIRGFVVPTNSTDSRPPRSSTRCRLVGHQRARARRPVPPRLPSPASEGSRGHCRSSEASRHRLGLHGSGPCRCTRRCPPRQRAHPVRQADLRASSSPGQTRRHDVGARQGPAAQRSLHLGRRKDAGRLRPSGSTGKLNNVREALEICATSRTIMGANGVSESTP